MPSRPENLFQIGEFARLAGTNLRTIRYYEELGLLRPTARSAGGFRYYDRADLLKIDAVRRLQEVGLPLAKIRRIFALPHTGVKDRETMLARAIDSLEAQRRLLREKIGHLEGHVTEVDAALKRAKECTTCPMRPPLEAPYCDPCQVDGNPIPGPFRALL